MTWDHVVLHLCVDIDFAKIYFINNQNLLGIMRGEAGMINLVVKKYEVDMEGLGQNIEY